MTTAHQRSANKLHELLGQVLQRYHIEYEDHLTNHISQGLIALYRLGASEEQLQKWSDGYLQNTLDPVVNRAVPSEGRITEDNFRDYLGKKVHFLDYVDFYHGEITKRGLSHTITRFMEILHRGECGAAFHAMIQLGYGADVMNDGVMAEGLAYLSYAYTPFFAPRMACVCPNF